MNGIHEVTGSIPVWSTIFLRGDFVPPAALLTSSLTSSPPREGIRQASLRLLGLARSASLALSFAPPSGSNFELI
jgi:hypothetical protein